MRHLLLWVTVGFPSLYHAGARLGMDRRASLVDGANLLCSKSSLLGVGRQVLGFGGGRLPLLVPLGQISSPYFGRLDLSLWWTLASKTGQIGSAIISCLRASLVGYVQTSVMSFSLGSKAEGHTPIGKTPTTFLWGG